MLLLLGVRVWQSLPATQQSGILRVRRKMHYITVALRRAPARLLLRTWACVILSVCWGIPSMDQSTREATIARGAPGVRATHILGFADAGKKANGTLSIQAETL